MKKKILLFCIGVSCLFIVFQIKLYKILSFSSDKKETKELLLNYVLHESLLKHSLFLIDENILNNISYHADKKLYISSASQNILNEDRKPNGFDLTGALFVENSNVVTFGVHASQFHLDDELVAFMNNNHIKLYEQKSNLISPLTSNTTHIICCTKKFSLHIVVFYVHPPYRLWHGALNGEDASIFCGRKLQYTYANESLYPSFQTKKVIKNSNLRAPVSVHLFLKHKKNSLFIECNQTRADIFSQKYLLKSTSNQLKFQPQYQNGKKSKLKIADRRLAADDGTGEAFRGRVRELLGKVVTIFSEAGISFWLSSGTCLGWFRQCDVIDYSKDVDIGIRIDEYNPDLIQLLEDGGFRMKHLFGEINDSYELSFIYGDLKLDIFFFYVEGDIIWNGGTQTKTGLKFKYVFNHFNLCWTRFLNLTVQVPCPTLPYIVSNYGANWFEPISRWDWKNSPSNVRTNGLWPKHRVKDVIQIFE